jgi:hypothetical protein
MDEGTLIFKRDITDSMIRLEAWQTKEGIYIQTFSILDDSMLSSDLIPKPIRVDMGKLLEKYGQSLFNNQSLFNEDARIKGDCNDNDTPLEDYDEYSQTHTVHRDDDGERN